MSCHCFSLLLCVIASSCVCATTDNPQWLDEFRSKIDVLPEPSRDCYVCFYEAIKFTGSKFCVGKREEDTKYVNPIVTPGTIGSIKFSTNCDLVVNVRVADAPFDEHVTVISTDVAETGYSISGPHSVEEVYIEEAGNACFLGLPSTGLGFGVCYTANVKAVEDEYRDSLTELLLFKTQQTNFDVIAYSHDNYNRLSTPNESADGALHQRFSAYSKILETDDVDLVSRMNKTLQYQVRSVRFVKAKTDFNATLATPYPAVM